MTGTSGSVEPPGNRQEEFNLLVMATCRLVAAGFGDEQLTKDLIEYIRRCSDAGIKSRRRADARNWRKRGDSDCEPEKGEGPNRD